MQVYNKFFLYKNSCVKKGNFLCFKIKNKEKKLNNNKTFLCGGSVTLKLCNMVRILHFRQFKDMQTLVQDEMSYSSLPSTHQSDLLRQSL
jgi:hypothetical protein